MLYLCVALINREISKAAAFSSIICVVIDNFFPDGSYRFCLGI